MLSWMWDNLIFCLKFLLFKYFQYKAGLGRRSLILRHFTHILPIFRYIECGVVKLNTALYLLNKLTPMSQGGLNLQSIGFKSDAVSLSHDRQSFKHFKILLIIFHSWWWFKYISICFHHAIRVKLLGEYFLCIFNKCFLI